MRIPSIWHPLQPERSKRWCSGRARRSTWWSSLRNIYKCRPRAEGWGMRVPKSVAVSLTQVIHEEGRPDGNKLASRTFHSLSLSMWREARRHGQATSEISIHVLYIDLTYVPPWIFYMYIHVHVAGNFCKFSYFTRGLPFVRDDLDLSRKDAGRLYKFINAQACFTRLCGTRDSVAPVK